MKEFRLITRADDAGSSESANLAIAQVLRAGAIKNVSVMAPGAKLAQAADLLAGTKGVCFGMHGTLNAEWDRVKWKPVASLPAGNGLVDENGDFLADPALFLKTQPPVELVLKEFSAQLDLLTRAGFAIVYIDTHMLPEAAIPGLDEALEEFAQQKGLIDHMYYYSFPEGMPEALTGADQMAAALRSSAAGQYFFVAHPALDSEEMRTAGNSAISGGQVARQRGEETRWWSQPGLPGTLRQMGVRTLRYDEAEPLEKRLRAAEVAEMMGGG